MFSLSVTQCIFLFDIIPRRALYGQSLHMLSRPDEPDEPCWDRLVGREMGTRQL
ncbi:hypothetical protein JMJ77_0013200, partial [Colletotrichum scovillei]